MVAVALVCCGLWLGDVHEVSQADLRAYEAARTLAGRDANAHVRLALWCEAHGLNAERLKHLSIAVLADPTNETARSLMGLVKDGANWRRPEEIAERIRQDSDLSARLAEYNARRTHAANTADAHWKLATWCDENGLRAEAIAHFTAVTRLDPARAAAWKRLGFTKHNGHWTTEAQLAAQRAETEAQQQADKHWRPLLSSWKGWLRDPAKQAEAAHLLSGVTDPRAVRSVWMVFARGKTADQGRAAQLLGQIQSPAASRALATLAVFSESSDVRRNAAETLSRRDLREFLDLWIAQLRDPIKYEVRPVGGPGSPGVLFVEGKRFNVQRLYAPPAANISLQPGDSLDYDENGLPVAVRYLGVQSQRVADAPQLTNTARQVRSEIESNQEKMRKLGPISADSPANLVDRFKLSQQLVAEQQFLNAFDNRPTTGASTLERSRPVFERIPVGAIMVEAQQTALAAERQLESDVASLEAYNASIREPNERVSTLLRNSTGQDFGVEGQKWHEWWVDQQGYSAATSTQPTRPTIVQDVPLVYQPRPIQVGLQFGAERFQFVRHSCFGAGTMVRTRTGMRPIEDIHTGDQVLTQNIQTGALGFQSVLAAYHNPPAPTLRVAVGDDSIVVTGIHRFWKAGTGWTMARDLKVGDNLRTLGGLTRITAVETGTVQPVFNLEVAAGQSFFVGQKGSLVHDNSLVAPVPQPFDAPPTLTAARSK